MLNAKRLFRGAAREGRGVVCAFGATIMNPRYMEIGDMCYFGPGCRIEAWDRYRNRRFSPHIVIGRDVRVNSTCHIGAIRRVEIGDECLLGSHVMIIDHAHGRGTPEELLIHPSERDLYSKGEIVIGKRCWICENAVILPGVHIGDGCVIGAGAVVTKDIPAHSVAAGNPAKVVRRIEAQTASACSCAAARAGAARQRPMRI